MSSIRKADGNISLSEMLIDLSNVKYNLEHPVQIVEEKTPVQAHSVKVL
jgi:hypothetical protein